MRDPSNNNAVRINYDDENYNGARRLTRNFVYNNSNTNGNNVGEIRSRVIDPNNLRRMRRARMSFVNAGLANTARRLNFGNSPKPASPPKAPKKINVSLYEKRLKNLENKNKKPQKNNKPNPENKNVANWFNNGGLAANKSNIPKDKRAFLLVDITKDGKIKHVYDRRYLWGMIRSWEKGFNENMGKRKMAKSPITKHQFGKGDIRSYPPDKRTKTLIQQSLLRKSLEDEAMKMKYTTPNGKPDPNSDMLQQSIDKILFGIKYGRVKTMEQLKLLMLVHQIVGPATFSKYYDAVLNDKFKPHHIEMMKKVPEVVTLIYNSRLSPTKGYIYDLSPKDTKLFIDADPYLKVSKKNATSRNDTEVLVRTKLRFVADGANFFDVTGRSVIEKYKSDKKLYNLLTA